MTWAAWQTGGRWCVGHAIDSDDREFVENQSTANRIAARFNALEAERRWSKRAAKELEWLVR